MAVFPTQARSQIVPREDCTRLSWVVIDQPHNPPDPETGEGQVKYAFSIGKYEVTNAQYAEFLNAVASHSDPYGLYNSNMQDGLFGGIGKIEGLNECVYTPLDGFENLPVVYVSWFDAIRFANWLHYGKPTGVTESVGSTEGTGALGAYDTTQADASTMAAGRMQSGTLQIPRNAGARVWLPTRDEWYKAAYYDPHAHRYFNYPTRSDSKPVVSSVRAEANYFDFRWAAPWPYLTPVGTYLEHGSGWGTFDQGGNVCEWVESELYGVHRRICGGAATTLDNALFKTYVDSEYPDHELYSFGFRMAGLPELAEMESPPVCLPQGVRVPVGNADALVVDEPDVKMAFVQVGDPGNGMDPLYGFGMVAYEFEMGQYEVTNAQYAQFLNAVARTSDPFGLFNESMHDGLFGGIVREGESGDYLYRAKQGWTNRPVVYVSWFDVARLANWHHYGKPNTGRSEIGTTEGTDTEGAYDTRLFTAGSQSKEGTAIALNRNSQATYWIPSEDEWYKAAYYDPTRLGRRQYWDYANRSCSVPNNLAPPGDRDSANYFAGTFSMGRSFVLSTVGAYRHAGSYYGTFDQGGNVWEWTEDWRRGDRDKKAVRGGSATYSEIGLHSMNTDPGNPSHEKFIWGGRLARRCQTARPPVDLAPRLMREGAIVQSVVHWLKERDRRLVAVLAFMSGSFVTMASLRISSTVQRKFQLHESRNHGAHDTVPDHGESA